MRIANILLSGISIVGIAKFDPVVPVTPPIIDDFGDPEVLVNFYNESYYGAFTSEMNAMVKFKFEKTTQKHYFCARYYNYRTNSMLIDESYKLSEYLESDLTLEYTLKCKSRLNSDGLRIVFSTENSAGTEKTSKQVIIYPTNGDTIYSYQYVNKAYTIDNRIFKIESDTIKNRESVRFENTVDYLTNDVDNAIDISEVSFTYNEGINLINKTVNKYLKILDLDNIFPYLSKDANGYINVPLECVQNGIDISLKYKNRFFYNPSTLDISFTGRSGFIETDKFFIPKGKLKLLENATFAVEMMEFGRSKFNIVIPLNFVKDRNYLGLCSDSSHCIIGGIRE